MDDFEKAVGCFMTMNIAMRKCDCTKFGGTGTCECEQGKYPVPTVTGSKQRELAMDVVSRLNELSKYNKLIGKTKLERLCEKAIMKKPLNVKEVTRHRGKCPSCGAAVDTFGGALENDTCPNCGQGIDWSEWEKDEEVGDSYGCRP